MPEVLAFVEDPGAADFVRHLKRDLNYHGIRCQVVASGEAISFLRRQGVQQMEMRDSVPDMLDRLLPQVVLVGTSTNLESAGLTLVKEAKARRIVSVGLVDALPNAAFRWSGQTKDPLAFAPDMMLVPDLIIGQAFKKMGYPSERLLEIGYCFVSDVAEAAVRLNVRDRVALRRELLTGWKVGQTVLGFISEGSYGQNAKAFLATKNRNFMGRGHQPGRTEVALEEFLAAVNTLPHRPYVSVRLHPKQQSSFLKEYKSEIDFVSHTDDKYAWLYALDGVCGMTSTLMLEAALMGLPSLSLIMSEQEEGLSAKLVSGKIRFATSRWQYRRELVALAESEISWVPAPIKSPEIQDSRKTLSNILLNLI